MVRGLCLQLFLLHVDAVSPDISCCIPSSSSIYIIFNSIAASKKSNTNTILSGSSLKEPRYLLQGRKLCETCWHWTLLDVAIAALLLTVTDRSTLVLS